MRILVSELQNFWKRADVPQRSALDFPHPGRLWAAACVRAFLDGARGRVSARLRTGSAPAGRLHAGPGGAVRRHPNPARTPACAPAVPGLPAHHQCSPQSCKVSSVSSP